MLSRCEAGTDGLDFLCGREREKKTIGESESPNNRTTKVTGAGKKGEEEEVIVPV